jgi:ribulose-5-phosphate 4-epimerase/fuculose-1-phosphate aldolase
MDTANTDVVTAAVEAHWALAAAGLSDMVWGHASIRRPDGTGVSMKAAGWSFEEIQADRIVGVSFDGQRIEGDGKVHLEVPIHTQIMLARPDVNCVVHTHAPAVAAFASLNVELRPISHDGVIFADGALPRFDLTGDLISSAELGEALAATLGTASAVIIPQHGMVTAAADAIAAVMYASLLERACKVQLLAGAAGGPNVWSSPDEVIAKRAQVWPQSQRDAGYKYLVRRGETLHRQWTA